VPAPVRHLSLAEVLELHRRLIERSGGADGLRDLGALQSAVAQPWASFGGADLYPSLEEKATALGFSLIRNHAFVDGNKRVGHAAMAVFLLLNGRELVANVDEAERAIVGVAASELQREELLAWVRGHVRPAAR
jgi:death-on-curing protein